MMNYFFNIKKTLSDVALTAWDICLKRYPDFVYKNKMPEEEIPVFLFHKEDPYLLELKLRFLKENRYKTLSIDEYYKIIRGEIPFQKRTILLTIDDGDISLWQITYPLLKKYSLRATAFIIPGLMDKWDCLVDFKQANIMYRDGIVDFQSHTYSHKLVPVSCKLIDFIAPRLLTRYQPYELSHYDDIKLGMPLYCSSSRMGHHRKWLIDKNLLDACAGFIEKNGGRQFFDKPAWRKELTKFYYGFRNSHKLEECYETEKERETAIFSELNDSKRLIEEKIQGSKVEHLSLPWNVTSTLAQKLAMETGYKTIFLGKVRNRYYARGFPDPCNIPRVSSDFLCMLEGEGRETLFNIILKKIKRRVRTGSSYLTH